MTALSIVFRCIVYREWNNLQVSENEAASSRSFTEQRTANCNSEGKLVRDVNIVVRPSSGFGGLEASLWVHRKRL